MTEVIKQKSAEEAVIDFKVAAKPMIQSLADDVFHDEMEKISKDLYVKKIDQVVALVAEHLLNNPDVDSLAIENTISDFFFDVAVKLASNIGTFEEDVEDEV